MHTNTAAGSASTPQELVTPHELGHDDSLVAIVSKVAWRIMPLIMICYLFAFFDRINISFAKFALQSSLSLSDTAYGLGAGLFSVGYVLFEVPSNMMLYKVGARRWIARIMVSWGIATALMALVQTEWQFYALRFVIGAMEAGFAPGVLYFLTCGSRAPSAAASPRCCSWPRRFPAWSARRPPAWCWRTWTACWACRAGTGCSWSAACRASSSAASCSAAEGQDRRRGLAPRERTLLAARIAEQNRHDRQPLAAGRLKTPGFLMLGLVYFLIQVEFLRPEFLGAASDPRRRHAPIRPSSAADRRALPVRRDRRWWWWAGCRMRQRRTPQVRDRPDGAGDHRLLRAGVFDHQTGMLVVALAIMGAGVVASIPAFWALPPKAGHRRRRGGRHRADQYAGPARRHRQPGHGRPHQGPDRQHHAGAVPDRPCC
jgi:hypothetical protein